MNTDNPQTYDNLLTRIIFINIFFVLLMTFFSFLVFLSYDYPLWQHCPKIDIIKVFLQNIRFNLSIAGYFNIPVFILLVIFLLFKPAHIMKLPISILKSLYLSAFVATFSLLTLSHLLKNSSSISTMISTNYFSKLSAIYSNFGNSTFMTLLVTMSIIFLIIVIFFILLLKFFLNSKEYTVEDYKKAMVSTIAALLLCVFFAKGKIIGHLTVQDAYITPVIQLNEYAVSGPYKILHELKKYDFSNINIIKDRKVLESSGLTVLDDEEKAGKQLYRFYPKQSE